jgi:biopolymer transport protein ExbB
MALHGGGAMLVIGICSLLAVGVAIERALALWGLGESSRKLSETVIRSLYRGDIQEARKACERSRSPFADMLLAAFTRFGRSAPEAVQSAVERERAQLGLRLRARLWLLGTIGAVAPFVGLFGTVVGIMRAFKDMAAHPGGGFAIVSSGISEALIATAAGIAVAIEAVVFYNFFTTRGAQLSLSMKIAAEEVLELLFHGRPDGGADAVETLPQPQAGASS